MFLDVDPQPIAQLIIDGNLLVTPNRNLINITAESIWVRLGTLKIGNKTNPFSNSKAVIQLNGQ